MTDVKIKCDSCKFVDGCVDYGWSECKKFTQKPSEPMTNEEWLNILKLDAKAYWLANTCRKAMWDDKYDNNDEKSTLDY